MPRFLKEPVGELRAIIEERGQIISVGKTHQKRKEKKRLRQQGNPCKHELRKKFTSGASTRQTSTIKQGRRSLVGVGRVLKRAICSFLGVFQPPTCIYDLCCILKRMSI